MRQLEKRVSTLETEKALPTVSLAHVPDDALDRMEAILTRPMEGISAEEAAFFQSYGFLVTDAAPRQEGEGRC